MSFTCNFCNTKSLSTFIISVLEMGNLRFRDVKLVNWRSQSHEFQSQASCLMSLNPPSCRPSTHVPSPHRVTGPTFSLQGTVTVNTKVTSLPAHGGVFGLCAAVSSQGASLVLGILSWRISYSWSICSSRHSANGYVWPVLWAQTMLLCLRTKNDQWVGLSTFCRWGHA